MRAFLAVLVAISIPIFSAQLEKAREATDEANIRSAYAEVMASALTETGSDHVTMDGESGSRTYTYTGGVKAKQQVDGWASGADSVEIGGVSVSASTKGWDIVYTESTGKCTITPQS